MNFEPGKIHIRWTRESWVLQFKSMWYDQVEHRRDEDIPTPMGTVSTIFLATFAENHASMQ